MDGMATKGRFLLSTERERDVYSTNSAQSHIWTHCKCVLPSICKCNIVFLGHAIHHGPCEHAERACRRSVPSRAEVTLVGHELLSLCALHPLPCLVQGRPYILDRRSLLDLLLCHWELNFDLDLKMCFSDQF